MADISGKYILSLEAATATDGKAFMLEFTTKEGTHTLYSNSGEMEGLLAMLLLVAQEAAEKLSPEDRARFCLDGCNRQVAPVNAVSAHVAPGPTGETFVLSVHLGPLALSFSLPSEQRTALSKALTELGPMLRDRTGH